MITTNLASPTVPPFIGTVLVKRDDVSNVPINYSVQAIVEMTSITDLTAYVGVVVRMDVDAKSYYAEYPRYLIWLKVLFVECFYLSGECLTVQAGPLPEN